MEIEKLARDIGVIEEAIEVQKRIIGNNQLKITLDETDEVNNSLDMYDPSWNWERKIVYDLEADG